jgi:putative colanic acid biosynthesis UDP-glucose lipid carrier transferase
MSQKYTTFFRGIHISLDYVLLNISLYVAYLLEQPDFKLEMPTYEHKLFFWVLNLLWFLSTQLSGLYNNILKRDTQPIIKATLISLIIFVGIPLIARTLLPSAGLTHSYFLYISLVFLFVMISWKTLYIFLRQTLHRLLVEKQKVVIIGADTAGIELYEYLAANPQLGYQVAGIFDDRTPKNQLNIPFIFIGKVKDCMNYVAANGITEIFCALPSGEKERINRLMQAADQQMVRFRLVPDLNGFDKQVKVELYDYIPVLTPRQEPLENKSNELVKRVFDILFASFVMVFLLSWFIPLIAVIIKLNSKGPVFFKQLRSGKDNQPFYCYKFRSMTVNTDSDSRQASKGDMRITKVGAFLRKTSIDELPQFINVLRGEMSIVGPRPHMLKHTEDYAHLIDNYMVRQFLTPGITGWAQVNGYRGETKELTAMSNRVNADIWYLENWSFLLDIKIVFLTVWQSVKGHENAF